MKRQLLLSAVLTAALATGFAFAPAAFADGMKTEGMSNVSKMSSDKTEKSGKMDSMPKTSGNGMHKDGMSGKDKMKDGMGK